jgi:hypothetical protein
VLDGLCGGGGSDIVQHESNELKLELLDELELLDDESGLGGEDGHNKDFSRTYSYSTLELDDELGLLELELLDDEQLGHCGFPHGELPYSHSSLTLTYSQSLSSSELPEEGVEPGDSQLPLRSFSRSVLIRELR